jgi:hypothetical protein
MVKKNDNLNETDKEKKTNKEKILSSLLEGPKTSTQFLIELGYKNNQHKYISKDLAKLKQDGLIVSEKIKSENLDDDCTQWSLDLEMENLSLILKKYPELLSKMQNSYIARENICQIIVLLRYARTDVYPFPKEEEEEFNERLRLSPEYFKYYVQTENVFTASKEILKFKKMLQILRHITLNSQKHIDIDDLKFKICVLMDVMKDQSSEEAIKYLIKMENKRG